MSSSGGSWYILLLAICLVGVSIFSLFFAATVGYTLGFDTGSFLAVYDTSQMFPGVACDMLRGSFDYKKDVCYLNRLRANHEVLLIMSCGGAMYAQYTTYFGAFLNEHVSVPNIPVCGFEKSVRIV